MRMATLNLPINKIHRIVTQGGPNLTALASYVGKRGEFLLDPTTGNIVWMDGTTEGGILIAPSGGDSLTGFTSSLLTDAPNDAINASVLTASGGTSDQDIVLVPTGAGGFSLTVATGDGAGGNKRGSYAVDLQIFTSGKNSPTQIASGSNAFAAGVANTASGNYSTSLCWGNVVTGEAAFAEGFNNQAAQFAAHAEGESTTSVGYGSHSEGQSTVASGDNSHAEGHGTTASG